MDGSNESHPSVGNPAPTGELSEPDGCSFTVALFRDAHHTVPSARVLGFGDLMRLVAPEQPDIRTDVVADAARRVDLIDRCLAYVVDGLPLDGWLSRHSAYRRLERALHVGGDVALAVEAEKLREEARKRAKNSLPCWSPAVYAEHATRGTAGVLAVSSLVLDYDDGTSPEDALAPWRQWPLAASSTWSHEVDHARIRVTIPLEVPVPAAAWKDVWISAVERAAGRPDLACSDPGRLYFLPALKSSRQPYFRFVHDPGGRLLRLDWGSLPAPQREADRPRPSLVSTQNTRRGAPASPRMRRAWMLLKTDRSTREWAAARLGARLQGGRAEGVGCPSCGRDSVWFYLEPGAQATARCKRRNSCDWWGHLDQLLDRIGASRE